MPNGQYQLGELLGRGGMGEVHVARHRSGRLVAVKRVRNTLSSDQLVVARLADEERLLLAVSHPHVAPAPPPPERLPPIPSQLFAGLTAIHNARIVHADLKSHNVLVDDVDIVTI